MIGILMTLIVERTSIEASKDTGWWSVSLVDQGLFTLPEMYVVPKTEDHEEDSQPNEGARHGGWYRSKLEEDVKYKSCTGKTQK